MTPERHALRPGSRNQAHPARADVARAARHGCANKSDGKTWLFCREDQEMVSNGEMNKDRHKCGEWASADQFEILADPP